MPDNNSLISLSPADFADTGMWRLIIYISRCGMRAYLKHISDRSRPAVELFNSHWGDVDDSVLLSKIENTVYDHPSVLDDYATDILIETPRIAWAPNEFLDEEEGSEESVFKALFPQKDSEVCADRMEDLSAIWSLTRGLEGFIGRTIPGARIRCHLSVLVNKFRLQTSDSPRIYVDIREREVDIIAFHDANLLSASTQSWRAHEDILYRIFNLMKAYDIDPAESGIYLSGDPEIRKNVTGFLRKYCGYVVATTLPSGAASSGMPTAAALLAFDPYKDKD